MGIGIGVYDLGHLERSFVCIELDDYRVMIGYM